MNSPLPTPAAQRIAVIEDSLRAFAFGWIGLVPLLGLPFAIAALRLAFRARRRETNVWNPSAGYRVAAQWLGSVGTAAGMLILVLVIGAMVAG